MNQEEQEEYLSVCRDKFVKILDDYESVTVLTHINPDADTIGTALGLASLLRENGKRVEVVNVSANIPKNLDFLRGYEKIKKRVEYKNSLLISCDCGDEKRLGIDISGRELVNIDHHSGNTSYGLLNIVLPHAVSASEVAYRLIKPIIKMNKSAAEAFYTALMSDTRNFTTSSVSAKTFEIALELIKAGANPGYISRMLILRRSLSSLRLLSFALSDLELFENGKIAVIRITKSDIQKTGALPSDLDGIVDYGRSLVTVEVAILIVEYEEEIRVSLRSKEINVQSIAQAFGGGGHINASGFTKKGIDMNELCKEIIKLTKFEINREKVYKI